VCKGKSYDDLFVSFGLKRRFVKILFCSYDNLQDQHFVKNVSWVIKEASEIFDLDFNMYLGTDCHFLFFAFDEFDKGVGLACGSYQKSLLHVNIIKVDYLYVKASNRYQGIGSKLLREIEIQGYKWDCKRVELVDESSDEMPWMVSSKFKPLKRKQNFYSKNGYTGGLKKEIPIMAAKINRETAARRNNFVKALV
jgi:GNAT superfamily N-acetyltransferase